MHYRISRFLGRVVFLALVAVPLLGCNTMEGLGKDIQAAGRVIENTADRND